MIAPLLFAAFGIALIAMSKADKPPPGGAGSLPPLPDPWTNAPPPVVAVPGTLDCGAAVAGLPEPLRSQVGNALAASTDPIALIRLAEVLEAASAMYPAPIGPSAAVAAQCVRARAATVGGKPAAGAMFTSDPVASALASAPMDSIANYTPRRFGR